MIFRRFFPSSSTGANPNNSMKRWWRFQQTLNKKRWLEMDREKNGPITLWDFSRVEDAQDAAWVDETSRRGGWRISDDSVIGGYSRASLELIQTPLDYQLVSRGESSLSMQDPSTIQEITRIRAETDDDDEKSSSTTTTEKVPPFVPFIRWKGTIDTRVNPDLKANLEESGKNVLRSGFCAIRSPEYPMSGVDLGGRYNGLEFTCRSDGRPYSVNLKCESFVENDMFQCFISIPPTVHDSTENHDGPGPFDQVVLLFHHFSVTSGGRMRTTQRVLDDRIRIQSVGFTLMDGLDGKFQFDLASIRAVNYDATGVIGLLD